MAITGDVPVPFLPVPSERPLPTQNYVLIQFRAHPKEIVIHRPDGAEMSTKDGDIVVLATGPDVPKQPPMGPGTKVILRADANHAIYGMDGKEKTGLIKYEMILAVLAEDETPTDAEIDAAASAAPAIVK